MEDPESPRDRRTLTPAIVASAVFVAACAVFAIAFVGARGGLEMPVAASLRPVANASNEPAQATEPVPTGGVATSMPTISPSPVPTPISSPAPSTPPTPTTAPSAAPTFAIPTLEPGDPLLALPECPGHPGCFEYTIVRFDTLSGIISRFRLDIDVLKALNPGQLSNPSVIRTGQVLYLGRDPLARLDPCPNGEACALYVVQAGDSVAEIADRYLLTREAILAANPELPRPIQPGQVIKLPRSAT